MKTRFRWSPWLLYLAFAGPLAAAQEVPAAVGPGWHYEVEAGPGARALRIHATFARGSPRELSVDSGAERYVQGVEILEQDGWHPIAPTGTSWFAPACELQGCRIRYRFLLSDAAQSLDDVDRAKAAGSSYLALPSTWLLRPLNPRPGARARLHVRTPAGTRFVTGMSPASDGAADTYEADVTHVHDAPYSAFGSFTTRRVRIDGAWLEVAIPTGELAIPDRHLEEWVGTSARNIAGFYRGFPVKRAAIILVPTRGDDVVFGTVMGNGGAGVVVLIGRSADVHDLETDWVLTHEFAHLALPSLPRRFRWLREGLATYVEPLARARRGLLSPRQVWSSFMEGMPRGQPGPGDRGLDRTAAWGRIYWGGAMFCLLADVKIRERTGNQRSLDDALRAITKAGGNLSVKWSIERVLAAADQGTGVPVVSELYEQMAQKPVPVDLQDLWKRLGIAMQGERVVFDDKAPLARIRRSITEP